MADQPTGPAAASQGSSGSFDYQSALAAGYSPQEIADYVSANPRPGDIDVKAALAAGYSPDEIVQYEASKQPKNLLGAIVGPQIGNAVHDGLLSVIPGSVQRGAAHAVEGMANTADVMGMPGVGGYLHNQVNQQQLQAPQSSDALGQAVHNRDIGGVLSNLPGAVGEALPQLGAAMAGAGAGAAIGSATGGPAGGLVGFATGAGADALTNVIFQAGDLAKARAAADGRSIPNDSDISTAVGSSAVLGALGRIGLGEAAGSMVANAVKSTFGRDAAGPVATAMGSMLAHGTADAVQSVGQQLATTAGTAQGATVDPDAAATQAIVGAGSRGAIGVARGIQDRLTGQSAADAATRQADVDRAAWAALSPEDQTYVQNLAGAGGALQGITDRVPTATVQQAARTAVTQRAGVINNFLNTASSDDVGLLNRDQVQTVQRAVQAASRPGQVLTPAHTDPIYDLPLPFGTQTALAGTLAQMDMLSNSSNLAPVGGPVSQAFGLAGHTAAHMVNFHGLPGFIARPVMNWVASKAGSSIDALLGARQPKLRADANRAMAMLDANGLPQPNTMEDLQQAITQTKTPIQAMATALGLDPDDYGPNAAERQALARSDVAAANLGQPAPTSTDANLSPGEAAAMVRVGLGAGIPSGASRGSLQPPSVSAGVPGAGSPTAGATSLLTSLGAMSDAAPEMLRPLPSGPAAEMAARLPRWQYQMGQDVQQQLHLAGIPKPINYAREAAATIGQLRDAGMIDGPLHDRLMAYGGQFIPAGFYNLLRTQWLLNHGVDRRTLEAQQADPRLTAH